MLCSPCGIIENRKLMVYGERILNHEGFAATALLLYIGISEYEALIQLVLLPVHLTPNYAKQSLAVYQYLDTILLNCLVECARFVDVLQMVCKAATASVLDSDLDQLW